MPVITKFRVFCSWKLGLIRRGQRQTAAWRELFLAGSSAAHLRQVFQSSYSPPNWDRYAFRRDLLNSVLPQSEDDNAVRRVKCKFG